MENQTLHLEMNTSEEGLDTCHPENISHIWCRVYLFTAELARHMRSHDSKQSQADFALVIPQQLTSNLS